MSDVVTISDPTGFNENLRYEYPLMETDTVLDIGSYRHEFCDEIIKRYGCKVECFDALDNRAAWTYTGRIRMGGNYLYTSVYSDVIDKEYWCVDIATYLQSNIALCKINIEGGEYELIRYIIDSGLMGNIDNLQVQFHLIEGKDCEKMYSALAGALSLTHELTWRHPFVWENWKRIN